MTEQHARAGSLRSLIALFALLLAVNVIFWPAQQYPGDTRAWLLEAKAILDRGGLDLRGDIPEQLLVQSGQFLVENESNHRLYSKYGIGSSAAILPAIWLSRQLPLPEMQARVISLNAEYSIVAALLGAILYSLARRSGARTLTAWAFVVASLYGTFAWQYLRAHTMDLFLCVYFSAWLLAIGTWRDRVRQDGRDRPALVVAVWLMVLMLASTRALFVLMVPLTIVVFAREMLASGSRRRALRLLVGCGLPAVGITMVLGAFNHIKFGAWYLSGYHQWSVENTPSPANIVHFYEFIVDPHFSPLIAFPVFAISLFGVSRFWKERRADYVLAIVPGIIIGAIYLLTLNWRGEWSEGPRYFLFVLPALSLPFCGVLERLVASAARTARLGLLMIAAWLLWTGTMQYLVLCRPFLAYYNNLAIPLGIADRRFAKLTTLWPRGYTMYSIWSALESGGRDPFLDAAREMLPPDEYRRYEEDLRKGLAPTNLLWFPSMNEMPATKPTGPQGAAAYPTPPAR